MADSSHESSDQELACLVTAGKLSAFEVLMGRYYARILQFVKRKVACSHSSEDLAQEVFVIAWKKADTYKPEYPYVAWLYTIARRRIASWYERGARVIEFPAAKDLDESTPHHQLSEREQAEFVWQTAADVLTDDTYMMMWMFYHDEIPIRQVAAAVGRSESAVKVAIFRARDTLKKHLVRAADVEDCYGKEVNLLLKQARGGI